MNNQFMKKCFVCGADIMPNEAEINKITSLPVCIRCKGTKEEKIAEQKALDSLAEDFTCGCI